MKKEEEKEEEEEEEEERTGTTNVKALRMWITVGTMR